MATMTATRCNAVIRAFYQRLVHGRQAEESGLSGLHVQAFDHPERDAA